MLKKLSVKTAYFTAIRPIPIN